MIFVSGPIIVIEVVIVMPDHYGAFSYLLRYYHLSNDIRFNERNFETIVERCNFGINMWNDYVLTMMSSMIRFTKMFMNL